MHAVGKAASDIGAEATGSGDGVTLLWSIPVTHTGEATTDAATDIDEAAGICDTADIGGESADIGIESADIDGADSTDGADNIEEPADIGGADIVDTADIGGADMVDTADIDDTADIGEADVGFEDALLSAPSTPPRPIVAYRRRPRQPTEPPPDHVMHGDAADYEEPPSKVQRTIDAGKFKGKGSKGGGKRRGGTHLQFAYQLNELGARFESEHASDLIDELRQYASDMGWDKSFMMEPNRTRLDRGLDFLSLKSDNDRINWLYDERNFWYAVGNSGVRALRDIWTASKTAHIAEAGERATPDEQS